MRLNDKYELMAVTLDVNDFCNMKCSYCWEQQCKNRMSRDVAKIICDRIIDNYNKHKKSNVLKIHFFGGEPLMDWDVVKFVMEYTSEKAPMWFGITTNGTLINDDILDTLKKYDVHTMISIDGTMDRHDSNRRMINGAPTHSIVVEHIKEIQDRGIDYELRMTILPEFAKNLVEDVTYLVEDLGAKNIAPVPVYDRAWSDDELKHFGKAMEDLYDLYIKYHFDYTEKVYIKFFEDFLYKDLDVNHNSVPCGFGGKLTITVDTNGNIYPCHQAPTRDDGERFIVGNIIDDEMYSNDLVKSIDPHSFYSDKCDTCQARGTICSGGCPMESYSENGDLFMPTCATCDFSKLYYTVIKKIQTNRTIPKPVAPSERRDFLHSAINRMLKNIRDIVSDSDDGEYDSDTLGYLSQAIWTVNEQIFNNKSIHLGTPDLVNEFLDVVKLVRMEVLDKNG